MRALRRREFEVALFGCGPTSVQVILRLGIGGVHGENTERPVVWSATGSPSPVGGYGLSNCQRPLLSVPVFPRLASRQFRESRCRSPVMGPIDEQVAQGLLRIEAARKGRRTCGDGAVGESSKTVSVKLAWLPAHAGAAHQGDAYGRLARSTSPSGRDRAR